MIPETEEYKKEYQEELKFLNDNGINNVEISSKEGETTLAEILRSYAIEYFTEHDQGTYGTWW